MKLPFDKTHRRRLYLVRHGQAAARKPEDGLYNDSITLTDLGVAEAHAMREILSGVSFDEAYSSDVPRARETAAIIIRDHPIAVQPSADFTEMRGDIAATLASSADPETRQAAFAYQLWGADNPSARFFDGDLVSEYVDKTSQTLTTLIKRSRASNILIVSHSGFQRATLCWAIGCSPIGMAIFEQDSCCLNVLDIDVDADGQIVRRHVRLANFTPLDPGKLKSRLTDGEQLASRLMKQLGSG